MPPPIKALAHGFSLSLSGVCDSSPPSLRALISVPQGDMNSLRHHAKHAYGVLPLNISLIFQTRLHVCPHCVGDGGSETSNLWKLSNK